MNIVLFTAQNQFIFIFNNVLLVVLYFFSRKFKEGLMVGLLLTLLISLQHFSTHISNEGLKIGLGVLLFLFTKCFSLILMGYWLTLTTRVGSFISAMQKAKIPNGIIITLSVVFRFLPTVKQENWYIKSTMKLRSIYPSPKRILRHPIITIEYALIPLIMRSMYIGNRLSAAAITRGLDLEKKRTSYEVVKLKVSDYILCILIIVVALSSYYFEHMLGGLL